MYGSANNAIDPILARSSDSGATWSSTDLAGMLGPGAIRIIAVDPTDPRHLFLRVGVPSGGEKLGVSTDGGLTFTEPVSVSNQLTAFARLASGTILVAGLDASGSPVGFRSSDGGATFAPWANLPHVRALAERDGNLYAAAHNFLDMFAVGVSTDEGVTWKPVLTYDQVKRVKACVQNVCQDVCDNLAGLTLWPQSVCGDVDAGSTPVPTPKSGCGCHAAGDGAADGGGLASALNALAAGAWLARRRRRRT
jgi:hypothetical protein